MLYIAPRLYGISWKGDGLVFRRGNIQWPNHLAQDIPSFPTWLLDTVKVHIANGVNVDPNVIFFSSFKTSCLYVQKHVAI
jgi:hypothetical protein